METKEKPNILFGLTPVITGVATLLLGFLTFNLQQTQNDLLKREFLPQFIVESTLSTSSPIVETVQVYHRGGGYSAFSVSAYSEYEVSLPSTFEDAGRPVILPVEDYFVEHFYNPYTDLKQNQTDGLVDTLTSTTTAYENVLKLVQTYEKDKKPTDFGSIQLKSYLVIGYSDVFGKRHADFYFVFPNFSYQIPREKGDEVFAHRYQFYDSAVSSLDSLDKVVQTAKEQKPLSLIEKVIKAIEQGRNEYKWNDFYRRTTGCTLENFMECNPSAPG